MQNIFDTAEKLVTVRALPIAAYLTLAMNHKYKETLFQNSKTSGICICYCPRFRNKQAIRRTK